MVNQNNYILIVNAGSSSIKFKVYDFHNLKEKFSSMCERIKIDGNFKLKSEDKEYETKENFPTHKDAFNFFLKKIIELKLINSVEEIKYIGHRVVQGKNIAKCELINEEIMALIKSYIPLAPLHNSVQYETIKIAIDEMKSAKNFAVFDTSFHTTIPQINNYYAIPKEWVEKWELKKYGFHGISYEYIVDYFQNKNNKKAVNLIICHLGNGASICCVKNGKSYDTSMGLSPNAGLIMGTRCGDIDFTIIDFILKNSQLTFDEIIYQLNNNSGLKGICGYSDYREVNKNVSQPNFKLAHDLFCKKITDYICLYLNHFSNNEIDGIVFTGGIGENSSTVRATCLNNIKLKNIIINEDRNKNNEYQINDDGSDINVYVINTNEELMIAKKIKQLN